VIAGHYAEEETVQSEGEEPGDQKRNRLTVVWRTAILIEEKDNPAEDKTCHNTGKLGM
jgi:hypothetical protein